MNVRKKGQQIDARKCVLGNSCYIISHGMCVVTVDMCQAILQQGRPEKERARNKLNVVILLQVYSASSDGLPCRNIVVCREGSNT